MNVSASTGTRSSASTGTREVVGVCNLCEAVCGVQITLEAGTDGERVRSIRGNPDDPLSRGHICPKGTALGDIHHDPDRLRRPVRRVRGVAADGADDAWEEIGWDEAIRLVVDGLADVQDRYGGDAAALYLGNPVVHSLGALTHGTQVARALGTRNIYSATSVDQLPQQLVAHLLYGHQFLLPVPDIDRTDLLIVVGGNPMASNGSLWTVPDFPQRLRELHARGGRLVVLDPRRTETARVADEHRFVRPGTDAAVLLAMLHVLFAEGLTAPPDYVDGIETVREAVQPFTPAWAAERSGVPADAIAGLARELAETPRAAIYSRLGTTAQEFGTVCSWAVQCLNILTGHLDREGGAMLTSPAIDVVGRRLIGRGHFDRWRSRVRDLPEWAGELPGSTMVDEITTPGDGQVRALLTISANPVLSTPAGHRLDDALADLEFMAAVDIYLNETTRHADVVLPPTWALERDHYDLAFHALAVRNTARWTPAVFPKPAGTRHDWEIFRDLALGLNARRERRTGKRAGLRSRLARQSRVRVSPKVVVDLLLRTGAARLSVRRLAARSGGVDLGPLRPQLPQRLQTRDRRVDLAVPLVLADLARVAGLAPPGDDRLLLIGRRHQRDCNSWLHNTQRLTKGRPRHQLFMHPSDLAARGLTDGKPVEVSSRTGSVEVEVLATDDVMPGVVSLPHGYGHGAPGTRLTRANAVPGVSINDLTDPERLDISGNNALNGVPVRVRPAG